MFKEITAVRLAKAAIAAAIYAVLTIILPLSYGSVQFRIAEILVLLCYYNKDYCVSVALGCVIANLFSPFALIDIPVGTAATILGVIFMHKCPNIYIASLLPVISNALLVGAELTYIYNTPFWLNAASVAIGEFAVICVVGVLLFRTVLQHSGIFMKLIGGKNKGE